MLLSSIQPKKERRRWYDQDSGSSRLLLLLLEISQPVLREPAAKLVVTFAERVLAQLQKMGTEPNKLGLSGIRERYLSGHHTRRVYDSDDSVRQAARILYQLPMQGLTVVSFQLVDTIEMLVVYSFACETLSASPDPKEVLSIIQAGLHEGLEEAHGTLENCIGPDLFRQLTHL